MSFLLQDEFTTDLSADAVHGTASEPGPGSRTVIDTEHKISISNNKLVVAGGKASPAWGDPGIWWPAITRAAGRIGLWQLKPTDATNSSELGFAAGQSGNIVGSGCRITADTLKPYDGATAGPTVFIPVDGADYTKAIILRAAGAFYFLKVGATWKLLWINATNATATLYPGISNYDLGSTRDCVRVPKALWLPLPLVSDGFSGADGTTNDGRASDGLGHAETTGIGSGGAGVVWSGASGSILGNKLKITPTAGDDQLTNGNFATDLSSWDLTEGTYGDIAWDAGTMKFTEGTPSETLTASQDIVSIAGVWYAFGATKTAGGTAYNTLKLGTGLNGNQISTTGWQTTPTVVTGRATSTTTWSSIVCGNSATLTVNWDNAFCKPLTLSSLFNSLVVSTADVVASVDCTITAGTQGGLVLNLDSASSPANFIICFHNGVNVLLEECVAGVYTTKINTAATYVAGATLRVVRDGTACTVYYNNVIVGTVQTMTANTNTKHGLFSTDASNLFDNFTAYSRGTTNEYAVMDALMVTGELGGGSGPMHLGTGMTLD